MKFNNKNHKGYSVTIGIAFFMAITAVLAMSGGLLLTQNLMINKPYVAALDENIDSPEIQSEFINTIVLKDTPSNALATPMPFKNESRISIDDKIEKEIYSASRPYNKEYVSEQYVMSLIKKSCSKLFSQTLTSYAILSLDDYTSDETNIFFWQGQCLTNQSNIIEFIVDASSGTLIYINISERGDERTAQTFEYYINNFNYTSAQQEKSFLKPELINSIRNIKDQLEEEEFQNYWHINNSYAESEYERKYYIGLENALVYMNSDSNETYDYIHQTDIYQIYINKAADEYLTFLKNSGVLDDYVKNNITDSPELSSVAVRDLYPTYAVSFPCGTQEYMSLSILHSSLHKFSGFQLTPRITGIQEKDESFFLETQFIYSFFYHNY